jgi:DNA-binding response OmpR family regulator
MEERQVAEGLNMVLGSGRGGPEGVQCAAGQEGSGMTRAIDPSSCRVSFDNGALQFTRTQFGIFFALFRAKGRILTHPYLMQVIEDTSGRESETRVLDTHLVAIRRKLAPFGVRIKNHHSIGYSISDWNFEVLPDIEDEVAV